MKEEFKSKCLAAFTSTDQWYPPFINAYREGGVVVVSVRSPVAGLFPDYREGPQASIRMNEADFEEWIGGVRKEMGWT